VRLCKHKLTGEYFAIKILEKQNIIAKKQVAHIKNERAVMSKIDHPFIVKLHKTFQDANNVYMVMEFVIGGELLTNLRRIGRFPNDVAKFFAAEVILAIEYLHSKDIVYRDLKPENILLDSSGHIKLTDFGFAKSLPDVDRTWTQCGTPEYLAPEIILNKGHGRAVDWWTLGILLYEMLVGRTPFRANAIIQLYDKILAGKLEFPPHVDPRAKDLISKLLQIDKMKRLGNLKGGAEDVKIHEWFTGVDWKKVAERKIPAPFPVKVSSPGDSRHFAKYTEEELAQSVPLTPEQQQLFADFWCFAMLFTPK